MNHIAKRKIQHLLFALAACCLCACGSKSDNEATITPSAESGKSLTAAPSNNENDKTSQDNTVSTSSPTPEAPKVPRYHATIYDNQSKGTKIELEIAEGDIIDIEKFTQLSGYNFMGCYDSQKEGGELYIDTNGLVCAEVVSDIILYSQYVPKNYTLSFTCNGKNASQYGVQNVNAAYDTDILEFLPLNRIINETDLIYSVSYQGRLLTDITENKKILLNEATFQDFETFANNTKIVLELSTVTVYQEKHFGVQEVCIKDDFNQFEQRFKDEYICDALSFSDIDFELLESLGFNSAIINVTCCMREKDDGNQEIYIYNVAYENNANDNKKEKKEKVKNMEDFLLKSETHDCNKKDIEETTTITIKDISLSRLKSGTGIYVYYGASGFGDDDWYRVYTDIDVTFIQKLDK